MRRFITVLMLVASLITSPYIGHAAKVVIDPGHGGSDPGAIGVNGLYEKSVNSEVAYRLRDVLIQRGYQVVMTRERDKSLTLQERVELSKDADADLFVSVHSNSHPSSSIRGTMILYHDKEHPNKDYPASEEMKKLTPESRKLAQHVLNSILEKVPNVNRGLVPSSAYVVRNGNIPSILVETAFLSNELDAKLLASSAIRQQYAEGIAAGITKYLPPTFSDIGKHWAKDSIVRLHDMGIADGSDGKFYPNKELTRSELVAFIDKAFQLENEVTPASVEANGSNGEAADETTGDEPVSDEAAIDEQTGDEPTDDEQTSNEQTSNEQTGDERTGDGPNGETTSDELTSDGLASEELTNSEVTGDEQANDAEVANEPKAPTVFTDLASTHWSYNSMTAAIKQGVIRGYPDGTVRPNQPVTRAELAAVFSRLAETRQNETTAQSNVSFKDVPESYWAYQAITQLSGKGIIKGISEGVYGPNQFVTRAQMAAMLDRQLSRSTTFAAVDTAS